MQTTATAPYKGASPATAAQDGREPLVLRKRIGSTRYTVNVNFSNISTETLEEKLLRLIEREVDKNA